MKAPGFRWGALSDRQKMILTWWTQDSVFNLYDGIIADGAIRSGKTVSMGFSYVLWAMTTFNGQNFGMCGKTIESFRRNVLVNLKGQLLSRGYVCTERKSENLVIISRGRTVNSFYLFGGKDERSQDLIQGITLAGCFFDEVALMPESFVNQATARCSVEGSKWWFNCNPAGPQHWFKVNWVNKCQDRRLVYLHFTMADNLTLSTAIKERYAKQFVGVFFRRYILGLWCIAEGVIYDMFSRDRHVQRLDPEQYDSLFYVSSDFGIQNANVWHIYHPVKGTNKWYHRIESVYSGRDEHRQRTVKELADDLDKICEGKKPKSVIIDPSATAMKAELRQRGYTVRSADNDVIEGISDVQTMLQEERLIIDPANKHTISEFESYAWDPKAADRGEDKPIKIGDHDMDATRYFVRTLKLVKRDGKQSIADESAAYFM